MERFLMQYGELISILLYLLPPILSLSVLCIVRRRMIWLAVPLTALVDLLIWGRALLYNYGEFRGIVLLFLLPQIAVTALIALLMLALGRHTSKK